MSREHIRLRIGANLVKTLAILIVILTIAGPATIFGQSRIAEIRQIDALVKKIDVQTKASKLVFADVSDYESDAPAKWQKFASEKALEKYREKSEAYSIAYVWLNAGRVEATNFTLFSPSGDWAKYVYSYFRPDSSLARAESELRTFYGNYIAIRRQYFAKNGKMIRETVKYLDLRTRKPKKPSTDFIGDNSAWKKADFYKTSSKLPFAHLLTKK